MENQPPTAIERSERSEDANLISQGLYNQPNEEITIDSTNEGAAHKIKNSHILPTGQWYAPSVVINDALIMH